MRMWPLVAPSARRRPISLRRSSTEMTMMLATPMVPTSSEMAPSPRNSEFSALCALARATRASDGRLTVDASRVARVGGGGEQSADVFHLVGFGAHVDRGGVAVEAEELLRSGEADDDGASISGASVAGCRIPTT